MRLSELTSVLAGVKFAGDAEINDITFDSRAVAPGSLFVALVGTNADGHRFVRDAVTAGASAVMVEHAIEGLNVPQVAVKDSRAALGKVSARFFDYPSRRLKVIGVTGTNGKTTTTHLIRSILEAAGKQAGLIGTIAYAVGTAETPAVNTTPESLVVQRLLSEMAASGLEYAAVEVSSHALDQGRVDDVDFAAAVFTNLSREHLDYHKDMPSYARAKGRLFKLLGADAVAVANGDDPHTSGVLRGWAGNVVRFGFGAAAEVRAVSIETTLEGSVCKVTSPWGEMDLTTPMPGKHNVYNCLAAAAVTGALGIAAGAIVKGVAKLSCVSGRLEAVDEGQPFAVFVDYAHSDDALENVLNAVRTLTQKRVIVVFGCGGDRDTSKRPRMRAVAEELADHCVVTSDNPRSEEPGAIIEQIMRGVRDESKFTVEPDRATAIRRGIELAGPGDVLLIAGKGHETYQIFKDRRIHFDDREVAREVLRGMVSK